MKKGFTLIELLAVIVILAIIALIATPIVLNIINDTKESAQLRSAEMYLSGVEQAIMRKNMNGTFNPNICYIENGNLSCDDKQVMVDVKGDKPTEGTITFQNGKINEVSLSFGPDVTIIKNEEGKLVYGVPEEKICKAIAPTEQAIATNTGLGSMGTKIVGVQATKNNPYARGAVYSCDLGDGPRIFYVLEETTTEIRLIMNENLVGPVVWASSGDNSEGPVTANNILSDETSGWTKLKQLGGIVQLPQNTMLNGEDWLIVNLQSSGEQYAPGYWTADGCVAGNAGSDIEGSEYHFAYVYWYNGSTVRCGVDGDGDPDNAFCGSMGIRPVITIPKESL